jgi:hypothetical protein
MIHHSILKFKEVNLKSILMMMLMVCSALGLYSCKNDDSVNQSSGHTDNAVILYNISPDSAVSCDSVVLYIISF